MLFETQKSLLDVLDCAVYALRVFAVMGLANGLPDTNRAVTTLVAEPDSNYLGLGAFARRIHC